MAKKNKITFRIPNLFSPVPILSILLAVASFLLGMLVLKIHYVERDVSKKFDDATAALTTKMAPQQQLPPIVSIDNIKDVFNNNEIIKFGDAKNKLLFVIIADPSCPYCQAANGTNPELSKKMGDQFTIVSNGGTYISPVQEMRKLTESGKASLAYIYQNGHGAGEMAMKSLFCAYEQKKFWETNDKLNTDAGYNLINNDVKNDKTASTKMADFLSNILDSSVLKKCMDDGKYDSYLASNQKLASSLGANGTPGFFINANTFPGAVNWDNMKNAVDEALK